MLVLLLMATTATRAQDSNELTGTLTNISIDAGATVTLNGVTINSSGNYAGITCLGDATIELKGENIVNGYDEYYPGIYIPDGHTLTIQGNGKLTVSSTGYCAGIGGGWYYNGGNIDIKSGTIIATGGDNAAGIGGGFSSSCGDIFIRGGNITATGGEEGAGIGAGSSLASCGNISITGGTVKATGGSNAAAIGGGDGSICGTITITDGVTSLTANKGYGAPNSIGAGLNGTCGNISLTLADNVNNGSTLASFNGINADVTLKRTLQTGGWNTFCAPFSIATPSGWTVKELTSSSFVSSTGKLTLNFGDASSIVAGKPYLVKVAASVVNPTFEGVTIANGTTTTETTYADFVPVMNPTPLTAYDKTVLFVSGGNKLTYPSKTSNINGFRAYFHLKGDAVSNASVFEMSFDDESTGITEIDDSQAHDVRFNSNGIYTLDGRRIEGQPTAKGIYIQNGRKVIIK